MRCFSVLREQKSECKWVVKDPQWVFCLLNAVVSWSCVFATGFSEMCPSYESYDHTVCLCVSKCWRIIHTSQCCSVVSEVFDLVVD